MHNKIFIIMENISLTFSLKHYYITIFFKNFFLRKMYLVLCVWCYITAHLSQGTLFNEAQELQRGKLLIIQMTTSGVMTSRFTGTLTVKSLPELKKKTSLQINHIFLIFH